MINDMDDTCIPKSDQINADDLMGGKTMTITITRAKVTKGDEQPCVLWYKDANGTETKRPYKPNKSMRRLLKHPKVWGPSSQSYVGETMILFCDDDVRFGAVKTGGVRIRNVSRITEPVTVVLTFSKGNKKPYTVFPMPSAPQQQTPAPEPTDEEYVQLKNAGTEAANGGVAAYTKWKDSLTPAQKERIKLLHSGFSKTATAADKPQEEGPGL